MKFYSRVLGDRDYSLLECLHFGLRLPATLSSFGPVHSVSISDWSTVKPAAVLRRQPPTTRATWANKRELFDDRAVLDRPASIKQADLENLSLYAFWRLFDVVKGKLVRKQKEKFVALSGTGWQSHAREDHPQQVEYARRTLLAYVQCLGVQGTDSVVELVRARFRGSWPAALKAFVLDPTNAWCPVWVARNYEVQNEVLRGVHDLDLPDPTSSSSSDSDAENDKPKFPHSGTYKTKYTFVKSGEPPADPTDEAEEPNPYLNHSDHWDRQNTLAWQQHSSLGPNVNPEGRVVRFQPLEVHVNPLDYDYTVRKTSFSLDGARATWKSNATSE